MAGRLRQELTAGDYQPSPAARVDTKPRADYAAGMPAIRDRVVQMAVLLVIGPIFEADLSPGNTALGRALMPRWRSG